METKTLVDPERLEALRGVLAGWPGADKKAWILELLAPDGTPAARLDIRTGRRLRMVHHAGRTAPQNDPGIQNDLQISKGR